MGMFVDETEYPVYQLGLSTNISTTLQRESPFFSAVAHKLLSSFMAFAWLIDMLLRTLQQPCMQTQKKRRFVLYPYLEAVGKARIMEISSKSTLRADIKPYRYHYTNI